MRNAIQHFFHPAGNLGIGNKAKDLSLRFLYSNIDPLLKENFGLYAIEYHEDHSVGYDYLVGTLLQNELRFSIPQDFDLSEISVCENLEGASDGYRSWFEAALRRVGKEHLLKQ
ncbi:MAG: hypothetical protein Q9M48_07150 [Rhodobacterales bacterium]|nr:hypothetical protein [Rhodobacterales bacterium]